MGWKSIFRNNQFRLISASVRIMLGTRKEENETVNLVKSNQTDGF